MPESAVVRVMREFKQDLLNREAQQVAEMTRRWGQVERSLEGRMRDLMEEIARTATSGTTLTEAQLMQMDRYRALLAQVQTQMRQYERESALQIAAEQRTLAGLGIDHAAAAIEATGIDMAFNRLPATAVEYMAGLAGDGSPLFDVLQQRAIAPDAIEGLTEALINGVAQGWNPRKTASAMADGLAQGLNKALVIARTEQLRVYRQANVSEYRASGVVSGYKRLSAHDERVCIGCLAADGQEVTLDEDFASHVCCRCTAVPIVEGMGAADWQAGGDWFAAQEESTQRAIMGPGRYDLWKTGQVTDFSQFATRTWSDTWGGAVVPTPLSALGG
jgi:SPP1 gp7 family putative phage head morphogenesis protein